jgi:hypothetical protein
MNHNGLTKWIFIFTLAIFSIGSLSLAQSEQRIEINPFFGYTFSDGVTTSPIVIGGDTYSSINPTSGYSYGALFGLYLNPNVEIGFLWSRQNSSLEGKGSVKTDFADMTNSNYHGVLVYNLGDADEMVRPFFFGGLGATNYSPGDYDGQSISGETRFSTTWGGGVKVYPGAHVGFSAMARWTPTYIKSDPAGMWCGWYGCYVLSDPQYSNQFEMSGGISLRF